jgi:nicotinamide mononucleotide transporter
MELFTDWISSNYIELLGAILGIAYVFFSIRQNILTWPTGLLTSLIYVWVFFQSGLYAEMGLQVYYVLISFYGWHEWLSKNSKDNSTELKVTILRRKLGFYLAIISLITFVGIWFLLKYYTNSTTPVADALVTSLSIIATWMLARKILEHWLIWIFVDLFSIALFWYKDLLPTIFLFIVYTFMAILGYIEWRKELKQN